jgi:predicted short-subunit dehydrogenase-like oxidoreductase (DUF2520 family)
MGSFRVVGPGRAGQSMHLALSAAGWSAEPPLRRGDSLQLAAAEVEVLIIATRDADIARVAAMVQPVHTTTIVHLAGALGTNILAPHPRRVALHPLVSFPDPEIGARRLRAGAWFATTGTEPGLGAARALVHSLGGHTVEVAEDRRSVYHAAACAAANHLVTLLAHVAELGQAAGVPLEAFLDLSRSSLDNVADLGPRTALTGPVARRDWPTILAHLESIPPGERQLYLSMVERTARLAGTDPVPEAITAKQRESPS